MAEEATFAQSRVMQRKLGGDHPPGFDRQPQNPPMNLYRYHGYPQQPYGDAPHFNYTPSPAHTIAPSKRPSNLGEAKAHQSIAASSCGESDGKYDGRRKRMENKLMDNLPTYDGKEAFDGYLTEFEAIYKVCGGDYDLQFSYLHTHLKGAARLWLHD